MKVMLRRIGKWIGKILSILLLILGLAWHAPTAVADCTAIPPNDGVLRVDAGSQARDPDGRSWACAYKDLQDALDAQAASPGVFVTLWIAEGEYLPSRQINASDGSLSTLVRTKTFRFPAITVLGGFPAGGGDGTEGARDPDQYVTILSGDFEETPSNLNDDSYHVVLLHGSDEELNAMTLDGLTITKGNANGSGVNVVGGGIYAIDGEQTLAAQPRIINCKIIDNYATAAGGGMISRKAGAFLRDCEFRNNSTAGSGFEEYAGGGGFMGYGPVDVIQCKFVSNTTTSDAGGGLHNIGASTKLVNSEFYGNSAVNGGGANASNGYAVNCLFAGNRATGGAGGGLVGEIVHGCTFADNKASGLGGGAFIGRATNSIFWGNQGSLSGEPYQAQMTVGCVNFRDADPNDPNDEGGSSRWNLIQDWACPPQGSCCTPFQPNIPAITTITTTDPKFVLPGDADDAPSAAFESLDYRLSPTSPAINSGDPSLSNTTPGYFPEDDFDVDVDGRQGIPRPGQHSGREPHRSRRVRDAVLHQQRNLRRLRDQRYVRRSS